MRTVFIAVVFVAALAACSRPEPVPEPVRAVRTITVGADPVATTQEYAAEIRARTESKLGFRVNGKLLRREVEVGDRVRAGQVLARLDPQDLRLAADAAQAAVRAAQVELDFAQGDVERFRPLREQGFISAAELERYETRLKAAQAAVAQAKAQAGVQGNLATYAELRADVAGIVTAVEAEAGAVLAAGAPVLRLAHDGPRDAVFSIPEDRVEALRALAQRPGALKVRPWGEGERWVDARLREIGAAADPVTRTFLAKADVGAAPVRLGQTATVVVEARPTHGVIRVPLAALVQRDGRTSVWVVEPERSTVTPREVTIGGAVGQDVVVAAGLEAGAVVVTAGVHVLTPGQRVTLFRGAPPAGAR